MQTLTLRRFDRTTKYTLGNLANEKGDFDLFTLEDAWKDNKVNVSCVPEGLYRCIPHNGKKWKDVWRLENVKGRIGVLIHNGVNIRNTEGCILVGMKNMPLGDEKILVDSKIALRKLKEYIGRDEKGRLNSFWLNIVNVS